MNRFNPVQFHYSPDGDPPAAAPKAPEPGEKPRFYQSDLDNVAGRSRAEGQARADEQWKSKFEKVAIERDTFKAEAEKFKGVADEFEKVKPVLEEHKTLKETVRQTSIERQLELNGCDPKRSKHARVLLETDGIIKPGDEIKDWAPIVAKTKEIFPTAFQGSDTKPSGGSPSGGKPPASGDAPKDDFLAAQRKRWGGGK